MKQLNIPPKKSHDQILFDAMINITNICSKLNISFMVFGSCGIQTYFEFFHLPNDIDIIVKQKDMKKLLEFCRKNKNIKIKKEQGRIRLYIDNYPIHVIPEVFSKINTLNDTVITTIDLKDEFQHFSYNTFSLIGAKGAIKIPVLSIEMSLFLELSMEVNTNTFNNIIRIFSNDLLNVNQFINIIYQNEYIKYDILKRISDYNKLLLDYKQKLPTNTIENYSKFYKFINNEKI